MTRMFIALSMVALVSSCGPADYSTIKSLTGPDYHGKKYYFGWGVNGNGNPWMDNEAKYDVVHTNAIFTSTAGGDYVGKTLIGEDEVSGSAIKDYWKSLKETTTKDDM